MARITFLALLLPVIALPSALAGQEVTELLPGSRVRVEAPSVLDVRATGTFNAADAAGLHMTLDDGASLSVPRAAVRSIHVSTGTRSAWKRGALIGGATGLAASAAIVITRPSAQDPILPELDRAIDAIGILAFTAGGAVVGGLTGALIRRERWERVSPTGVHWHAGAAVGGGVGVGVSFPVGGAPRR